MKMLRRMRDDLRERRNCLEVGRWLQHYLDAELEPKVSTRVEEHVETCLRCAHEYDTYWRIQTALQDTLSDSPEVMGDEIALQRLRRFVGGLAGHSNVSA